MKVTTSAPGKLMLLGDHAVVWGHPCLVTAVEYRVFVTVSRSAKDEFIFPDNCKRDFVEEALRLFREKFHVTEYVSISTKGSHEESYGLGSSSAVTVSLVNALSVLFDKPLNNKELFEICYKAVLIIQNVGSGFDIAAAIWGGTIYFFTGGKKIEPINSDVSLVVSYSGEKGHTPTLVKRVHELHKQKKELIDANFEWSESLVKDGKKYLEEKDYTSFGRCMNTNHKLLQEIGVSTPMLDKLVESAQNAGAYGAKLSGAGGGDCMIALTPVDKRKAVEKALKHAGGTIISVKTNAEGVRIEYS